MVVIESHKLVILLLRNLMTDGLTVDLCGHHILPVNIRTVGGDAGYFHPVSAFAIILQFKITAIDTVLIVVEIILHGDCLLGTLLVLILL